MIGFLIEVLILVVTLASMWVIYQKMGREGWEGVVPFYNMYVLFQELYGNGWRCLTLLIPLYNIYVLFKFNIDLAKAFHKDTAFGVGMALLSFIFDAILAFGPAQYKEGRFRRGNDSVSLAIYTAAGKITGAVSGAEEKNDKPGM